MAELTGYQIDLERRPRGHASLADLTRTLEVLEQRLDRVSQTRQEKRRSAQPRGETQAAGRSTLRTLAQETPASRPSYQAEAPQPRRRRPASLNDAVSEIVMRQKVLDRQPASQARQGAETRRDHRSIERPARSLALPAVETTVYAAENDAHRRRSTTSRAPAFEGREADDRVHPKSSSVEELRAELIRLREELGRDLASGVAGQVEDMRRAFADLRETIADKASVERIDDHSGHEPKKEGPRAEALIAASRCSAGCATGTAETAGCCTAAAAAYTPGCCTAAPLTGRTGCMMTTTRPVCGSISTPLLVLNHCTQNAPAAEM